LAKNKIKELEVAEEGAKTRKRTSEEFPFPTIEEINQGSIWGHNCVFNMLVNRMHPAKDAETNHRILNLQRAKDTYNWLLENFWNDISHVTLRLMEYVTERREQDGFVKQVVRFFPRSHICNDFEKAFAIK
jgi:hypothetical protein